MALDDKKTGSRWVHEAGKGTLSETVAAVHFRTLAADFSATTCGYNYLSRYAFDAFDRLASTT
jgi:hypothetical protein